MDIATSIAIFVFTRLYKNSSFSDAYWNVIPPSVALQWLLEATALDLDVARACLVMILVWLWGIRLTANCVTFRPGLVYEDWRYGHIKTNAKRARL